MTDLQEGTDQTTAERPSLADIEADPIAAALQTIELLQGKRAALLDRINVNRSTSAEIAFAAFTDGGRPKKNLDDLNLEAFALDRDLLNLDSAIAEAERRHQAACANQAAAEERGRAELARERFSEFARVAQAYSDQIDGLVQLYGELCEASRLLHQTGYGPNERKITRWGQRLIVYRCQHDRNLRFEDMMADGREREWLIRSPHDWHAKLIADTAAVLGPTAQAAE
jgi:hypothetical protein